MYERIGYVFALLMVGYLAGKNIKKRQLPVFFLLGCGIAAVVYLIIDEKINAVYIMYGIGPGMALLALSLVTRESIGYGDGVLVLLLGLWCGGFFTFVVVGLAFLFTGVYALFLLVKRRRQTIPFVPFLLAAMEVVFLYE